MATKYLAFCVGILLGAGPALAQAGDANQPWNNGSAADSTTVAPGDVARGYDPGTRAANLRFGERPIAAMDTARTGYEADRARYDAALRARHRTIVLTDAHYARQRQAYANAMRAWRAQVTACQSGNHRACRAPTSDPAAFY